jgi:streptomycin 6-kinase
LRQRFIGSTGPFPGRLVDIAERFFADLLSSSPTPVLLHGDLHHFNILAAGNQWIAIDPKGVAGEPAYEVAAFLENPGPECYLNIDIQRRRIEVLCEEAGLDRDRVLRYAIAHAVLSAWWSFEDTGSGWQTGCAAADVLLKLLS